jgi:hypothetical protein
MACRSGVKHDRGARCSRMAAHSYGVSRAAPRGLESGARSSPIRHHDGAPNERGHSFSARCARQYTISSPTRIRVTDVQRSTREDVEMGCATAALPGPDFLTIGVGRGGLADASFPTSARRASRLLLAMRVPMVPGCRWQRGTALAEGVAAQDRPAEGELKVLHCGPETAAGPGRPYLVYVPPVGCRSAFFRRR